MTGVTFMAVFVLAAGGYFTGRHRARALAGHGLHKLHSRPGYHGAYVAIWMVIPAFTLILAWLIAQDSILDYLLRTALPAGLVEGRPAGQSHLLLSEIKSVAKGQLFRQPDPAIRALAESYNSWQFIMRAAMFASAVIIALSAMMVTRSRISQKFRARQGFETTLDWVMIVCAAIAVVTTFGIVISLVIESARFFGKVPVREFLFGLNWEPQTPAGEGGAAAAGAFGAIPVFTGTLVIAGLALIVAVPTGLLSAIYLTQYAPAKARTIVKPMLEFLAGIPTVVYGFFAVLVIAPALKTAGQSIGLEIAANSALAAGLVMGIMIIPFISSLADDAISAVPQSLSDSALGLGATKGETITGVLLPAALPGIAGGILLAASRAIGETMIVVMAAGLIAKLSANPLEALTTVTVQIVTLLTGDSAFDNPKTLAAFALGLMLFIITLILNIIALGIVRRYREKYD